VNAVTAAATPPEPPARSPKGAEPGDARVAQSRFLRDGLDNADAPQRQRRAIEIAWVATALTAGLIGLGHSVTTGRLAPVSRVDAAVTTWLIGHRTPRRNAVTRLGSVAADSSSAITMATLAVVALTVTGHRDRAARLTTGMVGQLLEFLVSAQTVGRARPAVPHLDHDPPTASFPSGHTSASVVLYGTLADLAGRFLPSRVAGVVRPICWTVPPLVAAARVYRGMHHASDVLAGFGSGLVWLQLTRSGPE
jgi:undecaprenyl-diphosphatase